MAALHVASNLDLPGGFSALKSLTTGSNAVRLGAAIHQLQPNANGSAEQKKASQQARSDLATLNAG